jgi:hypothetical protein
MLCLFQITRHLNLSHSPYRFDSLGSTRFDAFIPISFIVSKSSFSTSGSFSSIASGSASNIPIVTSFSRFSTPEVYGATGHIAAQSIARNLTSLFSIDSLLL